MEYVQQAKLFAEGVKEAEKEFDSFKKSTRGARDEILSIFSRKRPLFHRCFERTAAGHPCVCCIYQKKRGAWHNNRIVELDCPGIAPIALHDKHVYRVGEALRIAAEAFEKREDDLVVVETLKEMRNTFLKTKNFDCDHYKIVRKLVSQSLGEKIAPIDEIWTAVCNKS